MLDDSIDPRTLPSHTSYERDIAKFDLWVKHNSAGGWWPAKRAVLREDIAAHTARLKEQYGDIQVSARPAGSQT